VEVSRRGALLPWIRDPRAGRKGATDNDAVSAPTSAGQGKDRGRAGKYPNDAVGAHNGAVKETKEANRNGVAIPQPDQNLFRPLFNGKNLDGWKDVRADNGSKWMLSGDGILEGHGGPGDRGAGSKWGGVLVSDRRNFTNFVLRVRVRFPENPGGRILIRHMGADDVMRGYPIQIFGSGQRPIGRIGRLIDPPADMGPETEPIPFPDDQWHTIEITAIKNRIASSVDGAAADLEVDADAKYMSGGIAVLCWANARIQIKEILIKELPDDSDPPKSARQRTRKTKN